MSWPMVTLESVSEFIRNGASIKQSKDAAGLPITRIETIADKTVNLDKCGYANVKSDEYRNYRLSFGDILISHINSEKHLAKCAIYEHQRDDIVHGMNLLCLRPKAEKVYPKYLFHYLSSPVFKSLIPSITKKSVNQASFTVTAFKTLQTPLPPLAEQKRIAAILDKADAIRRKRQQAIQLADDFLRSYLDSLFCKPLALKGSEDNDDSQFGKWVRLSDVARLESGHTPSRRKAEYWGGKVNWLSLKDVKNINSAYIFDTQDKPSLLGIENSSARLLPKGTVALCRTASVGKCVILGKEMATSQDFVNWVCGDLVLSEFLYATLSISQRFFDGLKQGSTHKTIYVPTVKDFHIFLPPVSTQRNVVNVLKSVMNFKKKTQASIQDFNLMFASTSQKAFSGQL